MHEASGTAIANWRYGIHPRAKGMRIRSLGRLDLPLGEALRLEMADPDAADTIAHLQYYIVTEFGAWALWISCPPDDVAAREAALLTLKPPFAES